MSLNEERKIVEGRNLSLIFCIRCQAINHITMIDSNEINETEEGGTNDTLFFFVQHICCHCTMNVILNESLVTNYLQTAI